MPKSVNNLSVKTSLSSSRKYPNVMWFPRSKTDPQEIREVLKLALKVQEDNPEKYFNDRLLGEYMVKIGSINVVGMQGQEYIEAYRGKSTGDVSYITNARMLMRVFRFLGLVTRIDKAKYSITDMGKVYCIFNGNFPSQVNGENEENMLLNALANFAFYSVNDDSTYRDASFQARPFISLLNSLAIEPQCIYQLIVTAFASKREDPQEIKRIKELLQSLRDEKSTLETEFKKLGLNANDYSCVHNFYDSAKIMVYIGTSLGLIEKTSNLTYGRKIAGGARHLKQASGFYKLTEKGDKFLEGQIQNKLIYYSDLYSLVGEKSILQTAFILASLNTTIGSRRVGSVKSKFYNEIFGDDWDEYIKLLRDKIQIEIDTIDEYITLKSKISFNFFQSIPPEFFHNEPFKNWYDLFIEEFTRGTTVMKIIKTKLEDQFKGEVVSKFILEKDLSYKIPKMDIDEAQDYVKYPDRDSVLGGQDRFASRISPTNSVLLVGDKIHVDNERDALDLLIPLRRPNEELRIFVDENIIKLAQNFLRKSDNWFKDQHYAWIRNCFRQLGAEAIYSGSSGMLSRADISIIDPFIGGIEAKSPTENRGGISTGAIRQALDAKVQVAHKFPEKRNQLRVAIAIGRRITSLAIEEEKKWRTAEGQSVLLISDLVLYYLTLKTSDISFTKEDLIYLFTKNVGILHNSLLGKSLDEIMERRQVNEAVKQKIRRELKDLTEMINETSVGAIEE